MKADTHEPMPGRTSVSVGKKVHLILRPYVGLTQSRCLGCAMTGIESCELEVMTEGLHHTPGGQQSSTLGAQGPGPSWSWCFADTHLYVLNRPLDMCFHSGWYRIKNVSKTLAIFLSQQWNGLTVFNRNWLTFIRPPLSHRCATAFEITSHCKNTPDSNWTASEASTIAVKLLPQTIITNKERGGSCMLQLVKRVTDPVGVLLQLEVWQMNFCVTDVNKKPFHPIIMGFS